MSQLKITDIGIQKACDRLSDALGFPHSANTKLSDLVALTEAYRRKHPNSGTNGMDNACPNDMTDCNGVCVETNDCT